MSEAHLTVIGLLQQYRTDYKKLVKSLSITNALKSELCASIKKREQQMLFSLRKFSINYKQLF